jgi:hypothetical protein
MSYTECYCAEHHFGERQYAEFYFEHHNAYHHKVSGIILNVLQFIPLLSVILLNFVRLGLTMLRISMISILC